MKYKEFEITQYYSDHWHFHHVEFDGAPDSGDKRNGFAETLLDAMAAIDEIIAEENED